MTDIEQKAQALINTITKLKFNGNIKFTRSGYMAEALCRAIEQHEAFRQEVSDAVKRLVKGREEHIDITIVFENLDRFIINQPDPLVEIIGELDDGTWGETKAEYADRFRAALDALGFEIREKNDGQ